MIITKLTDILITAAAMLWQMLWALVLGLALSAMIQAFAPTDWIAKKLGKPGIKALSLAALFGAVSSSCSYAAAAMGRALFQKGAHIITSLAFMLAATNLVVELGLVLWQLLGWQFVLAEFLGGILLIAIASGLMRWFGPLKAFEALRKSEAAPSESHCCHSQSKSVPKSTGWEKAADAFTNDVRMIWKDVAIGVAISALLMVLVPNSFWHSLFLPAESTFAIWPSLENALVGPVVAIFSFVCSVGNIPIAAALFHHGVSFGGTLSFIYADLIVIPLLLIYRKYYGWKLALSIFAVFYVSMVITGFAMESLFWQLHWIPSSPPYIEGGMLEMTRFKFDPTFWLNLVAIVTLFLVFRSSRVRAQPSH